MKNLFFIIFLSFVIVSCSSNNSYNNDNNLELTEDIKFRVEVLYEHTLLMDEYSSVEVLKTINLDMLKIDNYEGITHEDMINQMAESFSLEVSGSYEEKITELEHQMDIIMTDWAKLEFS